MPLQLAAKERRLQQLQRAVAGLQARLVAALERNALACVFMFPAPYPSSCVGSLRCAAARLLLQRRRLVRSSLAQGGGRGGGVARGRQRDGSGRVRARGGHEEAAAHGGGAGEGAESDRRKGPSTRGPPGALQDQKAL